MGCGSSMSNKNLTVEKQASDILMTVRHVKQYCQEGAKITRKQQENPAGDAGNPAVDAGNPELITWTCTAPDGVSTTEVTLAELQNTIGDHITEECVENIIGMWNGTQGISTCDSKVPHEHQDVVDAILNECGLNVKLPTRVVENTVVSTTLTEAKVEDFFCQKVDQSWAAVKYPDGTREEVKDSIEYLVKKRLDERAVAYLVTKTQEIISLCGDDNIPTVVPVKGKTIDEATGNEFICDGVPFTPVYPAGTEDTGLRELVRDELASRAKLWKSLLKHLADELCTGVYENADLDGYGDDHWCSIDGVSRRLDSNEVENTPANVRNYLVEQAKFRRTADKICLGVFDEAAATCDIDGQGPETIHWDELQKIGIEWGTVNPAVKEYLQHQSKIRQHAHDLCEEPSEFGWTSGDPICWDYNTQGTSTVLELDAIKARAQDLGVDHQDVLAYAEQKDNRRYFREQAELLFDKLDTNCKGNITISPTDKFICTNTTEIPASTTHVIGLSRIMDDILATEFLEVRQTAVQLARRSKRYLHSAGGWHTDFQRARNQCKIHELEHDSSTWYNCTNASSTGIMDRFNLELFVPTKKCREALQKIGANGWDEDNYFFETMDRCVNAAW